MAENGRLTSSSGQRAVNPKLRQSLLAQWADGFVVPVAASRPLPVPAAEDKVVLVLEVNQRLVVSLSNEYCNIRSDIDQYSVDNSLNCVEIGASVGGDRCGRRPQAGGLGL